MSKRKIAWEFLITKARDPFAVCIAILLTLLLHLYIYFSSPEIASAFFSNPKKPAKKFEVVYDVSEKDETQGPHKKQQPKEQFIQTNPNASVPQKTPDVLFYSAQSQLAAQETPSDNNSFLPTVDGDLEESNNIIQGINEASNPETLLAEEDLLEETINNFTTEHVAEHKENEKEIPLVQNAKPEASSFEIKESEGKGVSTLKTDSFAKGITVNTPELHKKSTAIATQIPKPKPRPTVDRGNISLAMKNKGGLKRKGAVAVDAKFSAYGEYVQRMFESIIYQWYILAANYTYSSEDFRSKVIVGFVLDKNGIVQEVKILDSSASPLAALLCKDAIQSRSPFGPWSKEMIETLGEKQEVVVRFLYF